jgi:hypothetical protein
MLHTPRERSLLNDDSDSSGTFKLLAKGPKDQAWSLLNTLRFAKREERIAAFRQVERFKQDWMGNYPPFAGHAFKVVVS